MNIIAFLAILMIFIRLYPIIALSFLNDEKVKQAERITIFILIFEIFVIFFYTFFNFLKNLLPPVLIFLNTRQFSYFVLKNISVVGFLYFLLNAVLLLTFQLENFAKFINRTVLIFMLLINIMLGFLTLIL